MLWLTWNHAGRCERFLCGRPACPYKEIAKILQSPLRIGILGRSSIEICKISGNCWLGMRASYFENQDLDLNDEPLCKITIWDQAFSHAFRCAHWLASLVSLFFNWPLRRNAYAPGFKSRALPSLLSASLRSPLCDMHRLVIIRLTRGDTGRQDLTGPSALL